MADTLDRDRGTSPSVYYHHLPKCGGTSMGHWLDQQVHDSRRWNEAWVDALAAHGRGEPVAMSNDALARLQARFGQTAFHWSEAIHTHVPIGAYAPPAAFRFTALRNPIDRLISQAADWRRLVASDRSAIGPDLRQCLEDVTTLRLLPWLQRHGHGAGRELLDNHMVRALAPIPPGVGGPDGADAATLLPTAQAALLNNYDLVGITEESAQLRHVLTARLGWAPTDAGPVLNHTGSADTMRAEAEEAMPLLLDLTRHDAVLYQQARRQFEQQWARHKAYNTAVFEATSASRRLLSLRGTWLDGMVTYSVRQPLIGRGFHGRDGAGTDACAVWTGPAPAARLYIPAPAFTWVRLFVWIRGYAAETQRAALRLHADGVEVKHRFEDASGYRDLLIAEVQTFRDFVRLDIDVGHTTTLGAPDQTVYDPRERGLSFDRYGWIPA